MTEHEKATPRPWQAYGSHIYGPDPDRTLVVLTGTSALVADRNLIVAAVNSYDQSRARIEELESEVQQRADDVIQLTGKEHVSRALIEQMRDALVAIEFCIGGFCPVCRGGRKSRHGASCDIGQLLAAAEKFLEDR